MARHLQVPVLSRGAEPRPSGLRPGGPHSKGAGQCVQHRAWKWGVQPHISGLPAPNPGHGKWPTPEQLPPKANNILEALLYRGELPRGDAATIVGTGERQARRVVSALIDHGVVTSESARAPLHLTFPATPLHAGCPDCFQRRQVEARECSKGNKSPGFSGRGFASKSSCLWGWLIYRGVINTLIDRLGAILGMDTLQQHQKNLLDALEAISRFGWLARDQITRILWQESTPSPAKSLASGGSAKPRKKGSCCAGSSTAAAPPTCCVRPEWPTCKASGPR